MKATTRMPKSAKNGEIDQKDTGYQTNVFVLGSSVNGQDCVDETLDCSQPSPSIFKLGDQGCACDAANQAGTLKYSSGKAYVCTGTEWKALQFENAYGTEYNPGSSCKNILDQAGQQLSDGVFWISMSGSSDAFPVYCDMTNGGWTLVFKAVSGVSSKKVWPTYNLDVTSSELVLAALDLSNQHQDHYKNRIVNNWGTFAPSQAKLVVFTNLVSQKELTFNAQGTDKLNWFAVDKLVTSSWTDIQTEPRNFFTIQGDCSGDNCRAFYINRNYAGCPADNGWLVFADVDWCPWENTAARRHHVLYSKLSTYANWNSDADVGIGDVLALFVQ